jgi:hypothetical protein
VAHPHQVPGVQAAQAAALGLQVQEVLLLLGEQARPILVVGAVPQAQSVIQTRIEQVALEVPALLCLGIPQRFLLPLQLLVRQQLQCLAGFVSTRLLVQVQLLSDHARFPIIIFCFWYLAASASKASRTGR